MADYETQLIKHYELLTDFLSTVLDKDHEIAVLDLRPKKQYISAIANGHNSGRQVGAPITDLALRFIREEKWKEVPYVCNYTGLSNSKQLISSSFFITYNNKLIGMLCININSEKTDNIEAIYHEMQAITQSLRLLLPEDHSIADNSNSTISIVNETFTNNVSDSISQAIRQCLSDTSMPLQRLTQEEKMAIVKKLSDMGFFLVKGAVSEIAAKLYCSDATIYRYLSKLEKKKNSP